MMSSTIMADTHNLNYIGNAWNIFLSFSSWEDQIEIKFIVIFSYLKTTLYITLRFKINGGDIYFLCDFWRPPSPLFINFSNFSRDYTEVHKHIIDSWCFVSVSGSAIYYKYRCWAKLVKLIRIIIFLSLFFYILSPPPHLFLTPPPVY